MKPHALTIILFISISASTPFSSSGSAAHGEISGVPILHSGVVPHRRTLHQPYIPSTTTTPPPSPLPDFSDEPFFPELPNTTSPPPPSSPAVATVPIPTATQPTNPTRKVAIAVPVGIVTLGMLTALAFYLYRLQRVKQTDETLKLRLARNASQRSFGSSIGGGLPPSSFLYIGTVEPPATSQVSAVPLDHEVRHDDGLPDGSPYQKLNSSVIVSDRYRPSPDLQPLPPLNKAAAATKAAAAAANPVRDSPIGTSTTLPSPSSSSDKESRGTIFYTPQGSQAACDEGGGGGNGGTPVLTSNSTSTSVPFSKRTNSPRSRSIPASMSPDDVKRTVIPPITRSPPENQACDIRETSSNMPRRARVSAPPPPPNLVLLESITNSSKPQLPPPPPPPPPHLAGLNALKKITGAKPSVIPVVTPTGSPSTTQISNGELRGHSRPKASKPDEEPGNGRSTFTARMNGNDDDMEDTKPRLKPLHWDKVRATSDRATVWDQLKSSSFQLNEDMMESLFGCNTTSSAPRETNRRSFLPSVDVQEARILDPKKSQNIAILLRALNVTRDEVSDALLDGNPEGIGPDLLETLVKMAPTKEEEIKLKGYKGDVSKLGTAERFLVAILHVPFAFKRAEAMLYRANFDGEVKYLWKSFTTLEKASEELKNSRLFLRLLEAVLRTGNRMNVGTNRGDAKAFKLDTLLKLVDIKGTDGKTTLLHFVVQEIIRSEGIGADSPTENRNSRGKEEEFMRRQGLKVVAGLSRELNNIKNAAGMDSDVLRSYVVKLESGLVKVRLVLRYETPDMKGRFFDSMKGFLEDADEEITKTKAMEKKALALVKEVTDYFHGNAAKEEAHPFRIFVIVRDFLSILDHVCKDVGRMQERTVMGSAGSFRVSSANTPLPVVNNRPSARRDESSDEESSPP